MAKSKVTYDYSLGAANGTLGECRHCSVDLILVKVRDIPSASRWLDYRKQNIVRGGKVITQDQAACDNSVFSGLHEPYLDFEAK